MQRECHPWSKVKEFNRVYENNRFFCGNFIRGREDQSGTRESGIEKERNLLLL